MEIFVKNWINNILSDITLYAAMCMRQLISFFKTPRSAKFISAALLKLLMNIHMENSISFGNWSCNVRHKQILSLNGRISTLNISINYLYTRYIEFKMQFQVHIIVKAELVDFVHNGSIGGRRCITSPHPPHPPSVQNTWIDFGISFQCQSCLLTLKYELIYPPKCYSNYTASDGVSIHPLQIAQKCATTIYLLWNMDESRFVNRYLYA